MTYMTVAIDGPCGSGKSTVARELAQKLNYTFVETGALYRAVAFMANLKNVEWYDEEMLRPIVRDIQVSFKFEDGINKVFIGRQEVTEILRTPKIALGASAVSRLQIVRSGLLGLQRQLAQQGDSILEGRDIGTVVCPSAQIKIYLDADVRVRAQRQFRDLVAKGGCRSFEEFVEEVKKRDDQDMHREHSPLKPANDAVIIDATKLTIVEVVDKIWSIIERTSR